MTKESLTKLALLGLAAGSLLAAQGVAIELPTVVGHTLAGNGCGGGCGGKKTANNKTPRNQVAMEETQPMPPSGGSCHGPNGCHGNAPTGGSCNTKNPPAKDKLPANPSSNQQQNTMQKQGSLLLSCGCGHSHSDKKPRS